MNRTIAPLLVFVLLMLVSMPAAAQQDTGLEAQLRALAANYQGKVALFASEVSSGKTVALNAEVPVPTASIIKLAVLFDALKEIQSGRAKLSEPLRLSAENQVEGSGVLGQFDTPLKITLKDALTMMIIVSDNTATNMVIDRLGLKNIDDRIRWMGLHNTWLYKKVFKPAVQPAPADQKVFGLGKTTAREMAQIMQRFATCNLRAPGLTAPPSAGDRKLCGAAINMLKGQTDQIAIPRYLSNVVVANKTGALDAVRNDVAILYAQNGPIIISAFTNENKDTRWTPENAGQLLIATLAKTIVERWH
ncbi:MAG: serine hydrolase [Candidatus Baltobacteraceae bacterium]